MIHSLRKHHRRLFVGLGFFLPVALAIGIAARRPVPEADSLPKELAPAPAQFESLESQRTDLFTKSPVQVHWLREHQGAGKFAVELSADEAFTKPDLMVYWVAGNAALTDTLPGGAVLLGTFSSALLPLPDTVARSSGQLVLFSLADNEIVDVSKSFQLKDSTR